MNTYEEIIKKKLALFPPAGTVEDNLKPEEGQVFLFDTECYRVTDKEILVWHDIWLPRNHIKIAWGEFKEDFVNVRISVPKWLVIKTFLNERLKIG